MPLLALTLAPESARLSNHPPARIEMIKQLPPLHPQRRLVHDEIHARFYHALTPPAQASWLALLSPRESIAQERECVAALCRHFGDAQPLPEENFLSRDLGTIHLRWERHNEFSTWGFFTEGPFEIPFQQPPIERLPADWLATLPGETIAAIHVALESGITEERSKDELSRLFARRTLVGNGVAGGNAQVWTDFHLHEDGFTYFLVRDQELTPRQAGRTVQRILDMETYRLLALLAWPLAREMMTELGQLEERLNILSDEMAALSSQFNEPERQQQLLSSLSALAAEVERIGNRTSTRFHASRAYAALVDKRFEQMRPVRIPGLQTLCGYINRRLDPAMRTCESVNERLESLATRISRTSDLLRTRVDVALESQNRDLLRSMNRRAHLQLRLQETVEGLSVVVISYYLVGLVGYLLKGLDEGIGLPLPVNIAIGISVPVVAGGVWLILKAMKARLARRATEE